MHKVRTPSAHAPLAGHDRQVLPDRYWFEEHGVPMPLAQYCVGDSEERERQRHKKKVHVCGGA